MMKTSEQIMEEARKRVLTRQICNNNELVAFLEKAATIDASVTSAELKDEAIRRGFYAHFGKRYALLLQASIDLAKDAIECRMVPDPEELDIFLEGAVDFFKDSRTPEKVNMDLRIEARQAGLYDVVERRKLDEGSIQTKPSRLFEYSATA